jgi:antitoxin MazE
MQVMIKKWGNSASVRIPAALLEPAHLHIDDVVDIREENGCIIIEPVRPKVCDLAALLEEITPDNLHGESDFGLPVGREAL